MAGARSWGRLGTAVDQPLTPQLPDGTSRKTKMPRAAIAAMPAFLFLGHRRGSLDCQSLSLKMLKGRHRRHAETLLHGMRACDNVAAVDVGEDKLVLEFRYQPERCPENWLCPKWLWPISVWPIRLWPHIVIAFIVIVYILMVYIVIVYIGMAYIDMAHMGMPHIVMAHTAMAHIVLPQISSVSMSLRTSQRHNSIRDNQYAIFMTMLGEDA